MRARACVYVCAGNYESFRSVQVFLSDWVCSLTPMLQRLRNLRSHQSRITSGTSAFTALLGEKRGRSARTYKYTEKYACKRSDRGSELIDTKCTVCRRKMVWLHTSSDFYFFQNAKTNTVFPCKQKPNLL